MAPKCGALYGVNGTAVPEGITTRPFSTNFHGYRFGGAGGWALQRVVTRLKITGLCPRRQSNPRRFLGPSPFGARDAFISGRQLHRGE